MERKVKIGDTVHYFQVEDEGKPVPRVYAAMVTAVAENDPQESVDLTVFMPETTCFVRGAPHFPGLADARYRDGHWSWMPGS